MQNDVGLTGFLFSLSAGMPTMESQSDERDHFGAVKHAADVPVVAIGDLCAGNDSAESRGSEPRHRMESRHPRQATGATAGMRHARLSTDVT